MKTIAIVGHCGFDAPKLRRLAESFPDTQAAMLNTGEDFHEYLKNNKPDLVWFNRIFNHSPEQGIPMIEQTHKDYPKLKLMLISNYDESQQEAIDKGAIQGFGKAALEEDSTRELISKALE